MANCNIPTEIVEQYRLKDLVSDKWVYIQIEKRDAGLKINRQNYK